MPEKTQRRRAGGSSRSRSGGARGSAPSRGRKAPQKPRTDIEPLAPVLEVPDIDSFTEFELGDEIQAAILAMGITKPTPIQALTIEPALKGKDIIAKAETGTGKTLAFGAPMMAKIDPSRSTVLGLVLSPTRELAEQVHDVLEKLGEARGVKTALVVGGEDMGAQIRKIQAGAQVIVGTPGRVLDLLNQKFLQFPWTEFAVLDEADKMLEIGFIDDVKKILDACNEYRNTLLFSATFPTPLLELARGYTTDPMEVATASGVATVDSINQYVLRCDEEDRARGLAMLIEDSAPSDVFLVFCERRTDVDQLMRKLERRRFSVKALHGGYDQAARFRVMAAFRTGEVKCLIATDVASRGLDVMHVTHVINLGVPRDVSDYTHRIGRTGRAGRHGVAVTFVSRRDERGFKELEDYTKFTITELDRPSDMFSLERKWAKEVDAEVVSTEEAEPQEEEARPKRARRPESEDRPRSRDTESRDRDEERPERKPRRSRPEPTEETSERTDEDRPKRPRRSERSPSEPVSEERPERRPRRSRPEPTEETSERTDEDRPRRPRHSERSSSESVSEERPERRPRRPRPERTEETSERTDEDRPRRPRPSERSSSEPMSEERPERRPRRPRPERTEEASERTDEDRPRRPRRSERSSSEPVAVAEERPERRPRRSRPEPTEETSERTDEDRPRRPRRSERSSSESVSEERPERQPRRSREDREEAATERSRGGRRPRRDTEAETTGDGHSEVEREDRARAERDSGRKARRTRSGGSDAGTDSDESRPRRSRAEAEGDERPSGSRRRRGTREREGSEEPKTERAPRSRRPSSSSDEESRAKPEAKRPKRAREAENAPRNTPPSRSGGFGSGV